MPGVYSSLEDPVQILPFPSYTVLSKGLILQLLVTHHFFAPSAKKKIGPDVLHSKNTDIFKTSKYFMVGL